jgi:hypothetical protein
MHEREDQTAPVNFFAFVLFHALQVVLGAHTCGPLKRRGVDSDFGERIAALSPGQAAAATY